MHEYRCSEKIRHKLLADPASTSFTERGWEPIYTVHPKAKILIVGQAPGIRAQESGVPWNDPSGDNLRTWLGVNKSVFYDQTKFALLPMNFYFPGTHKSGRGDLPPRRGFADKWHPPLMALMPNIELTILIGQYAQKHYLGNTLEKNLTETVRNFENYLPAYLPLVHPSPRNNIWQNKNPWFQKRIIPELRKIIAKQLS